MKALVHIGPPKSGTTSIQAFLRHNRQQLNKNHIATLPQDEWIRTLAAMFREKVPGTNWYAENSQNSNQSFAEFKEQARTRFRSEIKYFRSTTQLLVLSSEGLFSCSKAEIRALQECLSEFCDQIEIITYLRRQDFMAISKHKNKIRNKSRIVPITDRYQRNMNYSRQLQKWATVFGRENIIVRRFPDSAPQKFNLLDQFQSELAARVDAWSGDFETPAHRNIGWNWQATEFMRIANDVSRAQLSDAKFHRRLVRQIDRRFSGGEKPSINRHLAMAIVAVYRESNEQVRKTYFSAEENLFHDDFSRYPETDTELNQQFSAETAVKLSTELLAAMVSDNRPGRGQRFLHRCLTPLRAWVKRGGCVVNRLRQLCGI